MVHDGVSLVGGYEAVVDGNAVDEQKIIIVKLPVGAAPAKPSTPVAGS